MNSIQGKIGYDFTHDEHLNNALIAAHRSEKSNVASDGNRGMARIGQIAIEMAETSYAVLVEKARLTDINRRRYWWKDKKKVATACKVLDIEPNITRSTRQNGQELSVEVLNFALNAVIGAVWLDCQDENRSVNDSCNTVSRILGQIDSFLNSSMADSGDQNVYLTADDSAPVYSTGLVTQEASEGNIESDLDMTDAPANLETYEDFSVFPPLPFSEELEYQLTEQSSPQRFSLEQQYFLEDDAAESSSQNCDRGNIAGSLSAGTQGVGAQAVFSTEQQTVIERIMLRASDSDISVITTSKRALSSRESRGSVRARHTVSLQRKSKQIQPERDKLNTALHSLLNAERQKLSEYPQTQRIQLLKYLEYPQNTRPKDSSDLLRFLYLAAGSWHTLADFNSQLQSARESRRFFRSPYPFSSTALMAFNMICQLDNEKTTCILLKRYYAIKFLEDGQQSSQPCESMQVETPETFGFRDTPQRGNPQVRQEASEIKFLTSKIVPDVEDTSKEYLAVYDKVKRFRQLGKRLQILTRLFGIGVLVLLPSGPSFHDFSLTDRMFLSINKSDLTEFATLLEEEQGSLLRQLSNAVAPILLALAAFYQGQEANPPSSLVGIESLKDTPKALLALSPYNIHAD